MDESIPCTYVVSALAMVQRKGKKLGFQWQEKNSPIES